MEWKWRWTPGCRLACWLKQTMKILITEIVPGDRLTFVSDGVIEATNPEGELYGFERSQAISNESANSIAEAATRFGQEDDITVLTLTKESVQPIPPAPSIRYRHYLFKAEFRECSGPTGNY